MSRQHRMWVPYASRQVRRSCALMVLYAMPITTFIGIALEQNLCSRIFMDHLREVLHQVQTGKKKFAPEVSTFEAVKAFQPTAAAIKHANDHGYLSAVFRQSKMIDTHGCILEAIVTGPLSYEGLRFLEQPPEPLESADAKDGEVFQIKPSIWGVTVDLKAAYKRLKSFFRRRAAR